jgi:outer membrane protein TolC
MKPCKPFISPWVTRSVLVLMTMALLGITQTPTQARAARALNTYLAPLLNVAVAHSPDLLQARHDLEAAQARAG